MIYNYEIWQEVRTCSTEKEICIYCKEQNFYKLIVLHFIQNNNVKTAKKK